MGLDPKKEAERIAAKKAADALKEQNAKERLKASEEATKKRVAAANLSDNKTKIRNYLAKEGEARLRKYNSLKDVSYKLAGNDAEREKVLKMIADAKKDVQDIHDKIKYVNDDKNWNEDGTIKGSKDHPKIEALTKPNVNVSQAVKNMPSKSGAELNNLKQAPNANLGKGLTKAPSVKKAQSASVTTKNPADVTANEDVNTKKYNEDLQSALARTSPQSKTTMPNTVANNNTVTPETTSNKTKNVLGGIGKAWSAYVPLASSALESSLAMKQVNLGLKGLKQAGARPVGTIDPTFQANVDRAQAQSNYGFSPEQWAQINQENQNATNLARFAARNYAGGSGGNAFNMERSAINEGFGRGLAAKVASQNFMLDKQQMANQLSLQKAGMSRQLFEDKLNAWNQNQQAGATLMGTGIDNLIGSARYASALASQAERNNLYNQ